MTCQVLVRTRYIGDKLLDLRAAAAAMSLEWTKGSGSPVQYNKTDALHRNDGRFVSKRERVSGQRMWERMNCLILRRVCSSYRERGRWNKLWIYLKHGRNYKFKTLCMYHNWYVVKNRFIVTALADVEGAASKRVFLVIAESQLIVIYCVYCVTCF